uniref:RING-type E3 ubiquitin transferase n=1 Tax=Kalanchoe fedtschenkoi TaxID=63787 RepID=A0A7N0TL78_KALFE
MASSLEELLAEEGFKGRRSTLGPRHSTSSESVARPLHPPRRSVSQQGVKSRMERTRSDFSRYKVEVGATEGQQTRLREKFSGRERLEGGPMRETRLSGPIDVYRRKELFANSKTSSRTSEIVEVVEEEEELNNKFKDIYSNEIYSADSRLSSVSAREELGGYRNGSSEDIKLENRRSHDYRSLLGRTSSSKNGHTNTKEELNSKSLEHKRSEKHERRLSSASEPALDQVAIKAMISILTGHIKPFLHDEDFRNSLRVSCFSSLKIIDVDEGYNYDNKVISNLEQAIETVELAVDKGESTRDLKKASLQLSVITGLSSNDMKDAFTAEIPNFKLSACAHVYLSVIYKLQRKEKLSAKHILQAFCISPFQARNLLLPQLWDSLFSPHLFHLKKWYTDEADALGHDPSKSRKLKFLDKVYNDILDTSTFQFASYYKDWLTEGTEAPSLPLIHIPTLSVRGVKQRSSSSTSSEWTSSPAGPFSPQPMVSKRLYEAVFNSNNNKHGHGENVTREANDSPEIRSSGSSVFEEKQTVIYSAEMIKYVDQDMKMNSSGNKDDNFSSQAGQLLIDKDSRKLHEGDDHEEGSCEDEIIDFPQWNGNSGISQHPHAPSMKENELVFKSMAVSVPQMQKVKDSFKGQYAISFSHVKQTYGASSFSYEALRNHECLNEASFFANAPQEFMCPLTGRLLSDPVTMETGQTFERAAITEWLQSGNKTCPVTSKTLECTSIPYTNFILKRLIDNWTLDHLKDIWNHDCQKPRQISKDRQPEDQSAIYILEQLLTGLNKEERAENANHLISLGGLEFLLQRFGHENLKEAVKVAPLLLCCIEADPWCRFQIARDINKQQLFSLLHSELILARKYGVSLLVELLAPQKYSIYMEEAVDAIAIAMYSSLTDETVRTSCCKALIVLGGHISVSNMMQTGSGNLIETGCISSSSVEASDTEVGVSQSQDKSIPLDDEEQAREAWLRDVVVSLLGSRRVSFLDMISKCLGSQISDLVRTCLTTVAWLSFTLASLPDSGFRLTAFSALISQLKASLENREPQEHKVLASVSLLNFSRFPECRVLLMTIAEEILVPLGELAETIWTAKELYTILSREDLTSQDATEFAECRVLLMTIAEEILVPLGELAETIWTAKELYTILSREDLTSQDATGDHNCIDSACAF